MRRVTTRQLSQSGYSVVPTSDSAGAELAFKKDGPFDLLVTDVVMPGELQGSALAQRLREYQPDLPVIFLSGYPEDANVQGNGVKPEDVKLMKPVSKDALLVAIQTKLQP